MVRLISTLCLLWCGLASADLPVETYYTALKNAWGHVLDGYSYKSDPLGLRTNIVRDFGLTNNSVTVGYDNTEQLTLWNAKEASGAQRLNEQLSFGYDPADNLNTRTNAGLVQSFNVNAINELTNITRTGALTVSGATPAPATSVIINGVGAQVYGDFTFASTNGLPLADGNNTFTIIAKNAYNHPVTNTSISYLLSSISLLFDSNGNLTNDGTRSFAYSPENQLTNITVAAAWKSDFVHDGLGRRRIERDYTWLSAIGNWQLTNEIRFIYDGFILIQERDTNNNVLVTYTRGLDLSGSLEGAGGIGGLLARTDATNGSTLYHSDGVGNITALIDGRQNIAARYLYGPFGRLRGMWGPLAAINEMGFSSMPRHALSGLSLYPFRAYDPTFQRWITSDPIGELGGINLYGFVNNAPVSFFDLDGLAPQLEGVVFDLSTGKSVGLYGPDYSRPLLGHGDSGGSGLVMLAGSMVPGVGELMDAAVLGDPEAKWWEKGLAGASLALNAVTDGFLPNAGGFLKAGKRCKAAERTAAENRAARNIFKNNKDKARQAWEQKTGQKWPTDANGNPWPAEHTPSLKSGGDPMKVTPRNPGLPDPHNIPGPDGLTDYQRWGALGTPAREANK